ncbi:hypothetical protein [Bradyrhizobium sp. CCBAU 53415]|uniref:hypothetical protein n=1 Tax=Bradyrhizobium sp. CCBAU 53415 TaxID=1325119 RepID=UPI003FA4BC6A
MAGATEAPLRRVHGENCSLDASLALVPPREIRLFGYAGRTEWGISHCRMQAAD